MTTDTAVPETAAEPSTIALEILTDEELSVLTPRGVVVNPVLDDVPEAERDAVRRTAFRSLVARGIVDPPSADDVESGTTTADGALGVDVRVRTDVLSALTLRQSASAVVAVARTTSSDQDYWYAHLVEEIALIEEVGTDGLHRFALGHARDLPRLVQAAAVHPDAVAGDGESVELAAAPDSEAPVELLERLGQAYVRADVIVVRRDADDDSAPLPTLTGLFTGPLGSWSVLSKAGSQRAWAQAETVEGLTTRIQAVCQAAQAPTGESTVLS